MRKLSLMGAAVAVAAGISGSAMAGTIYVADYGSIYKFAANGTASTLATGAGTTNIGLAFDASGNLFVDSRDTNSIYKVSAAGVVSTFASISSPYGLAIDAAGDVFTTSPSTQTITEYTPGGVASTFATDPGGYGYSLAVNPLTGYLFEGDSNGNIYEYSPGGVRSTFATGTASVILGLTFDQNGDLYSTDWSGDIFEYTPAGAQSLFATYGNPSSVLATGLAYDYASHTLYMTEVADGVANCCTQQVYAFNAAGQKSVFAGNLYDPFAIADLQTLSSATPEPGTFCLLGGAGLLALTRRRRRQ